MLRKSLLASIALVTLNPVQASQATHPQHAQVPATQESSYCPPCPRGAVGGWILIPAGPGAPCNQPAASLPPEEVKPPHHPPHPAPAAVTPEPTPQPELVHPKPPSKTMHPLRTPEQEKLEEDLKPIAPHIFLRANPNSPDPKKKEGEWGKALNGKVYFRHLGNWVYDPTVNATTDIVSTNVKDKIKLFNAGGPNKPTPAQGAGTQTAAPAVKPSSTSGYKGKRYNVNTPDKLGTTQGRVQSVYTNPTEANERQFGLGAPNRAQTGVLANKTPPKIDVPAASNTATDTPASTAP